MSRCRFALEWLMPQEPGLLTYVTLFDAELYHHPVFAVGHGGDEPDARLNLWTTLIDRAEPQWRSTMSTAPTFTDSSLTPQLTFIKGVPPASDSERRQSAVTIWVAGFGVPGLAITSGLRTDAIRRLLTDETLTSVDDPRIVAAGDCASPSGVPLRMSCQSAGPLGTKAADTVLSRVAGTAPAVIDQAFLGACISLGRKSGILQFAHKDDRTINLSLSGRFVASIKEAVCKSTLWSLRREARKPGSAFWFKRGRRPEQPAFAPVAVTER